MENQTSMEYLILLGAVIVVIPLIAVSLMGSASHIKKSLSEELNR